MSLYVCADCDFHYIDALDDYPAEQPESLLTANAQKYIEAQLPQNGAQLRKNIEFVKQHVVLPGTHCLDIGSGAGQFPAFLQEEGAQPQGIEPQQIFREFARQKYNLELRRERVEDPYWQEKFSSSFDLITLWDTLEHVNFPAETLVGAYTLLKPGGYLFLDTPSRDSLFYRASVWSYRLSLGSKPALLNRLYSPKPYRHKQIFTAAQLRQLLEKCGLTVLGPSSVHRTSNKLVVACRKDPL